MARSDTSLARDPFVWIMVVLFGVCVAGVLIIFFAIWSKVDMADLRSQTFAIRLMQVTLGMVIGLVVTFLGVVVSWFGLSEAFSMEMDAPSVKGKLAAAGPGALLVICGTALLFICIQKEFRIYDTKPIATIGSSTDPEPS